MKEGRTVVCIASGPSLEVWQTKYIESKRDRCSVIAVNDAYKYAPYADIFYAADRQWWRLHLDSVKSIAGLGSALYCLKDHCIDNSSINEVNHVSDSINLDDDTTIYHGGNSGQHAVHLAHNLFYDVKKIILVGYDFQHTNGKKHFFGDHPRHMINAKIYDEGKNIWLEKFDPFCKALISKDIDVVNCSTETAIESCRRSYLSYEL